MDSGTRITHLEQIETYIWLQCSLRGDKAAYGSIKNDSAADCNCLLCLIVKGWVCKCPISRIHFYTKLKKLEMMGLLVCVGCDTAQTDFIPLYIPWRQCWGWNMKKLLIFISEPGSTPPETCVWRKLIQKMETRTGSHLMKRNYREGKWKTVAFKAINQTVSTV